MLVLVCSMAVTASSSRINPISPLRIKFGNASLGPYKVDFNKKVFDGQRKENFGRIENDLAIASIFTHVDVGNNRGDRLIAEGFGRIENLRTSNREHITHTCLNYIGGINCLL